MNMTVVRAVVAIGIGCLTYYGTAHSTPPVTLPWWWVIAFLVFPPVLMPLIEGSYLASTSREFRPPSWRRNPFLDGDPLQSTYEAGYSFLVCGVIWFFDTLRSGLRPSLSRSPLPLAIFVAGIGCWISVRVCIVVFRSQLKD